MKSVENLPPSHLKGVVAVLVAAACFHFGTGLHPRWWLTWFAAVPVLVFAYRASARAARVAAFSAYFLGGLNLWGYFRVLELPIPIRVLAFVGPPIVFSLGVLLSRAFLKRGQLLLAVTALPFVWVSFEYLNSLGRNGTALNLAYSQMNFHSMLQVASVTGIWGISFLVFFASSAMAMSVISSDRRFTRMCPVVIGVIILLGYARLQIPAKGEHVRIGLAATDRRPLLAPNEERSAGIIGAYADAVDSLAAKGAQVIVLPEKIGPTLSYEHGASLDAVSAAAARNHVMVVMGLDGQDHPLKHNWSFVFDPGGRIETVYEKHFMVPGWEDGYERGTTVAMLPASHPTWGTAICKDMDFPALSRRYAEANARLLFVPAWDFEVDDWLHGRMAVMRGVESGFAIARSAKQGLLTLSDDRGRILAQAHSSDGMAMLVADITLSNGGTIYARLGDWFAWLCLVGTVVLIWMSQRKPDPLR